MAIDNIANRKVNVKEKKKANSQVEPTETGPVTNQKFIL